MVLESGHLTAMGGRSLSGTAKVQSSGVSHVSRRLRRVSPPRKGTSNVPAAGIGDVARDAGNGGHVHEQLAVAGVAGEEDDAAPDGVVGQVRLDVDAAVDLVLHVGHGGVAVGVVEGEAAPAPDGPGALVQLGRELIRLVLGGGGPLGDDGRVDVLDAGRGQQLVDLVATLVDGSAVEAVGQALWQNESRGGGDEEGEDGKHCGWAKREDA